jgi:hypothetical protein
VEQLRINNMAQKTTLRAQWNSRQGCWRIVKKTDTGHGGWKMFGGAEGYPTRLECEIKIEDIVSKFPDQYLVG